MLGQINNECYRSRVYIGLGLNIVNDWIYKRFRFVLHDIGQDDFAYDGFRQDVSALVDVSFRTQRYAISELDITKRCKEAYLVAIGHIS